MKILFAKNVTANSPNQLALREMLLEAQAAQNALS